MKRLLVFLLLVFCAVYVSAETPHIINVDKTSATASSGMPASDFPDSLADGLARASFDSSQISDGGLSGADIVNPLRYTGAFDITGSIGIVTASEPALSITMTGITGTDNQVIDVIGGEALGAEEHWTGIRIKPDDLDPSGADTRTRGLSINLSGIDLTNIPESMNGLRIIMPSDLVGAARNATSAIYIEDGDIDHNYAVSGTVSSEFTAYDMVIDAELLDSTSVVHSFDVSLTDGSPDGKVVALGTHNDISPIEQIIGYYNTPSQTEYAGLKGTGGTVWADGIDGEEVFLVKNDAIYIGSDATFSSIRVVMGTASTKQITITFWYNTAADTWVQFNPDDDTIGLQQSGTIRWEAANIPGWTNDGDPGGGSASAGYWIKMVRASTPDPGTPTVTTMETGTVVKYEWDDTGDIAVKGITAQDVVADSTHTIAHGSVWDLADGEWTGQTVLLQAGENVTFGEAVRIHSDGKLWQADADSAITMGCDYLALDTISANNYGRFLRSGYICHTAWTTVDTPGQYVYVSCTTGVVTETAPTGEGDRSQRIGRVLATDIIDFRPSLDYFTVPAP